MNDGAIRDLMAMGMHEEIVVDSFNVHRVPGGWIYESRRGDSPLCFVPEPDLS